MAAIEQRIDLQSPIDRLLNRIAESFKGAVPAEATVKIHLEPTPLQEVEASLGRNKDASTAGSSSAKVTGDDAYVEKKSAAATGEIDKAFQRIEAMATRIGYLMQKIEGGKDATGNAAQELERLRNSLEKVADKGKEAANAMGDSGMAGKIDEAAEAAGQGKGGRASGGASVGDLQSMMNNPIGALKNQLMQKFAGPLSEVLGANMGTLISGGLGVGGTALAAGLGAAALAGGAMVGWKMNTAWAGEAAGDAQAALRDARISNSVGQNFDLRGQTFDSRRVGANILTKNGQSLDNSEVRTVLQGMGIGLDNFKGDAIESAMKQSRTALSIGVGTDQIASMVGAAVRSGAVGRDDNKVNAYLAEIAGATKESAKYGVASAEKLAVLASLNAKTQQESGMVSSAQSKLNLQASSALEASGQAPLAGQSGAQVLSDMAGSGSDDARAREMGFMLDEKGDLLPEWKSKMQANPYLVKMYNDFGGGRGGAVMVARALLDIEGNRSAVNQRAIRSLRSAGMNGMNAAQIMGVNVNSSRSAMVAYGGAEANDILTQGTPTDGRDILGDVNSPRGKEQATAHSLVAQKQQSQESRKTGMDFEAAESIIETNHQVSSAMTNLTNWLSVNVNVR
jgi:hypothetical protein